MHPQLHTPTETPSQNPSILILESRDRYRSCHIRVPDAEERLAAISIDNQYYSFFKIEKNEKRALEIADRLCHRGEAIAITRNPKGYAIWVQETEARPSTPIKPEQPAIPPSTNTPCKILASRSQYQTCHIRVPDLDKRLAAIFFDCHYYSLFKVVDEVQQALQIVRRLSYRGEETVITKTEKGYGLWILEPEAQPL